MLQPQQRPTDFSDTYGSVAEIGPNETMIVGGAHEETSDNGSLADVADSTRNKGYSVVLFALFSLHFADFRCAFAEGLPMQRSSSLRRLSAATDKRQTARRQRDKRTLLHP